MPTDGVAGEAARVAEERKCGAELRKYVDKNGGDVGWGEKGKRVGWGDVLAGLRRKGNPVHVAQRGRGLVQWREKKLTGAAPGSGAQLQRENPLIGELGREKETNKI
jgi:hypothetical protein